VQILLLSMPDSFEHTPTLAVRMPNGALASLAGNVDPHHNVAIADLVLAQSSVQPTVTRLMRELQPELVGLSVMTFQRSTARRIISLVKSLNPNARVVVGGYDPSLAPDAWTHPALGVDFIVRGEGDLTFRELIRALDEKRPLTSVDGLWFRTADGMQRNLPRSVTTLELHLHGPPDRRHRNLERLHVRLQLLLDHRDARPQLPSSANRARDRRHPRCPRSRRPRDLHRG
jgi:radical SAM superfamily enzyme YgiQ (UPF0313 family)